MNTTEKKAIIRKHIKDMLKESNKAMIKKIEKAMNCGAIDIESYNPDCNCMILPKTIMIALLETEAKQYEAIGTKFEKEMKSEVKNLKYYL